MEVLFLVVVYIIYGFHSVRAFYNNLLLLGGLILSISWIVAPFLFDSSPFDLDKNSEDRKDWKNWLNRISDKVEESWEAWWNKEVSHIRTLGGQLTGTILSLRFFIFPLVVGYKLDVQGLRKSLSNCVIPWICVVVILFLYEVICKKPVIQFFSINRVATIGALAIAYYYSAFGDMHVFIIAIITTVWGFISFFSNNAVATIGALAVAYYCSALGDMLAFFKAILATVWGFHSFFSINRVATIGALAIAYYYSAFDDMHVFIIAIITTVWGFISFFSNNGVATIGALAVAYYCSALGDMLAFFIAILATVWGFHSICVAWKPTLEIFSLWTPVKYLAWICDTGMRALWFNYTVSEDWGAWKPTLEIFGLWTPVTYLAWICDIGMGALMFKIANMLSQRSIKQYLVRNMFDQNISELLHKSSTELKKTQSGVEAPLQAQKLLTPTSSSISKPPFSEARRKYIDKLPETYHAFIDDVDDVLGDGNCGFQAVAVGLDRLNAVGRDPLNEKEWMNIRRGLLQELKKHKKEYRDMFEDQYAIVKNRLTFFEKDEVAPVEKWMQMPEIGVLIATHFKVILHVITNSGSLTYLPLYSPPPSWDKLKFISLGFVNDNHYVHLLLKKGYPVPDVVNLCIKSEWNIPYEKWINKRGPSKWMTLYRKWFNKREH